MKAEGMAQVESDLGRGSPGTVFGAWQQHRGWVILLTGREKYGKVAKWGMEHPALCSAHREQEGLCET